MRMCAAILLVTVAAVAMLPAQPLAFEAATVKVNRSGVNGDSRPDLRNGVLTARNVTLRMMLRAAYDLHESRIIGPDWLDSDRFDLAGKAPAGVPDSEFMPMMQILLKERFQLVVHRGTKEMQAFDMVVAKGGLKIWLFDPAHPVVKPPPPTNATGAMVASNGVFTMAQLATHLTGAAGRPVLDKTGLEGRYGFFLLWTQLSAESTDAAGGLGPPDFFSAVEQQLGLKLQPNREPVEILIVDHAERVPTEN